MKPRVLAIAEEFAASVDDSVPTDAFSPSFWIGTKKGPTGKLARMVVPTFGKYAEVLAGRLMRLDWAVIRFRRLRRNSQQTWVPEEEDENLPYPFHAMEPDGVYVLTVAHLNKKSNEPKNPF